MRIKMKRIQKSINRTVFETLFNIAWIGIAICATHNVLGTPKPFCMEFFTQTGFASGCFYIASLLKD